MSDVRIRDEIVRNFDSLYADHATGEFKNAREVAAAILSIPAIKEALSLKMQMDAAIEEFEARGGVAQDYKPN